jgi:DNA-binding MarR family transcriptional regulator
MTIATECNTKHNFNNFSDVLTRLDEFGLTPNQFRVYCHLWRMAQDGIVSEESSESIAKVCKLTRVTVIRVLSQLEQMHLIECDRAAGKKSVFYLMPYSDWRRLVPQEKNLTIKQQSKVVCFRKGDRTSSNSTTCKANIQVNEIHIQREAESPVGDSALPAIEPVNEINVLNTETGLLDEKLAAARARGWRDSGTWWNDLGQQVVTVNRFVISVAEFMQRSLDSFDVGRQVCAEGLRMCKEQIEKIKLKKQQQQSDRVIAIARVGNQLEQEFCYG